MGNNSKFTVVHLCIGMKISSSVDLGNGITAENAGYYGNNFLAFVLAYTESCLDGVIETVVDNQPGILPHERDPVIAIKMDIVACDHKDAMSKANEQLENAKFALSAGFSAAITLFGKVSIHGDEAYNCVDLPEESGFLWTSPEGEETLSHEASKSINSVLDTDNRLSHLLDLYHQAVGADHVDLKISLLYLCLEAIVSKLNCLLGGRKSKNAILLDRHYSVENLPLFQISDEEPIQVNHIDLAYEIRNSFFHGGSSHERNVNQELKKSFCLYDRCPDIFALALAFDCWRALYEWAMQSSKAYLSWNGKEVSLERNRVEKGGYRMHYLGDNKPRRGAAGIMIRCGETQGNVLFAFVVRFRSNPIAFSMEVPGGQDISAKQNYPNGYKLYLK